MSPLITPHAERRRARGLGRRGIAASEFALVAPLFFIILFATADVIRVFRAQIRMEMIGVQIGQIVSQCQNAITTPGDTDQFWAHAARISGGLVDVNSATGGSMLISAVSLNTATNANRLDWQVRTGNASATSVLGNVAVGGVPTLRGRDNASFLMPSNETLIVFEANAIVIPWTLSAGLIGTALPSEISTVTLFLTRVSDPTRRRTPPINSAARDCTA
jgi:Flp pilus assembly protein TadG